MERLPDELVLKILGLVIGEDSYYPPVYFERSELESNLHLVCKKWDELCLLLVCGLTIQGENRFLNLSWPSLRRLTLRNLDLCRVNGKDLCQNCPNLVGLRIIECTGMLSTTIRKLETLEIDCPRETLHFATKNTKKVFVKQGSLRYDGAVKEVTLGSVDARFQMSQAEGTPYMDSLTLLSCMTWPTKEVNRVLYDLRRPIQTLNICQYAWEDVYEGSCEEDTWFVDLFFEGKREPFLRGKDRLLIDTFEPLLLNCTEAKLALSRLPTINSLQLPNLKKLELRIPRVIRAYHDMTQVCGSWIENVEARCCGSLQEITLEVHLDASSRTGIHMYVARVKEDLPKYLKKAKLQMFCHINRKQ